MTRYILGLVFIPLLAFGQKDSDSKCSQIAIQRIEGDLEDHFPMKEVIYTFDTIKVDLGDSGIYNAYNPMYEGFRFYSFKYQKPSSTNLDMDLLDDGILEGTITFVQEHYQLQYEFSSNYLVKEIFLNSKGTKVKYYFSVPLTTHGEPAERPKKVSFKRIRRTKMVKEVVFCNGKIIGRLTPMKIEHGE